MEAFDSLKKGLERIGPILKDLIGGVIQLLFWESIKDLFLSFIKHRKKSKNWSQKIATVITGIIIFSFMGYGLFGLYKDVDIVIHKKYYEKVLFQDYETEVKKFFDKYNERYLVHDCGFMREVGVDEAMFDKWGKTTYGKDYKCETFINIDEKQYIPIKIEPIQKFGDKYRVKGEVLIVKKNQGEPHYIDVINFELWKKIDWDLWHFNPIKSEFRRVGAKMVVE